MKTSQLITFVGLALSHVQVKAIAPDAVTGNIVKLVDFMIRPDVVAEKVPGFEALRHLSPTEVIGLHSTHWQVSMGEVMTVLRDVGDHHSPFILQSLVGFHTTHLPIRREIYAKSLYSRLIDLARDNPATWKQHLEVTINHLSDHLSHVAHAVTQKLAPLGRPEDVEEMNELLNKFKQENRAQLNQLIKDLEKHLPINDDPYNLEYLDKATVNSQLTETNTADDKALLVNGLSAQATSNTNKAAPVAHQPSPASYQAPHHAANPALVAHQSSPAIAAY